MKKISTLILTAITVVFAPITAKAEVSKCEELVTSNQPIEIVLHIPLTDTEIDTSGAKKFICYEGVQDNEDTTTSLQYYTDYNSCYTSSSAAVIAAKQRSSGGTAQESQIKTSTQYQAQTACPRVEIIVGNAPMQIISVYINEIYRWAASIIGIIAVGVIAYSGIQMSVSQGENVDAAKARILQSLAALALLFLSGLILYTINPTFFTVS